MSSKATTLGDFIAEQMQKFDHSNRSLAAVAGVSEGAVRNVLKYGRDDNARDPDARTLSNIAKALEVDALRLFRLAGYIAPDSSAHSIRAEYLADLFDTLPIEKQDAVLGVLEAMLPKKKAQIAIQQMREQPDNPLSGIDLANPVLPRTFANELIAELHMKHPNDVALIQPDTNVLHYKWRDLPESTRVRVRALIQQKLSLDYDPTMVDPEWRE